MCSPTGGAPIVSIAGGEPLMHPQIGEIVQQLLDRKKIVLLCTNAVLMPKHLQRFKPHRNFAWMVHIDGLRERHDESVCKDGVFDQAEYRLEFDASGKGKRQVELFQKVKVRIEDELEGSTGKRKIKLNLV